MKKRLLPVLTLVLLIALLSSFLLYRRHQAKYVYLGGTRYPRDTRELDLSNRPADYLNLLSEFTQLDKLDLRGTGLTVDEYEQLHSLFPDCEILWELPFQGRFYPLDTTEIELRTLTEKDRLLLAYLPQLETIDASWCNDYEQLDLLRRERPELSMEYYVPADGKVYRHDSIALTMYNANALNLMDSLAFFPRLQAVTLIDPACPAESLLALRERYPDIEFVWHLDFHGIPLDSTATELDFTGVRTTAEEIEALIPYLPDLTHLDLSDCGIPNEELAALRSRHENIKIVWAVYLSGWFRVKTDITTFMPVKYDYYPRRNGLADLRYCTDIIAMDLGHMQITNCDFVAYMPKLQYLLLGDTRITDLTPLTGLTELIYLELFITPIADYSPLLTLTSLEDLNLCYAHCDPEILAQMTWLKNLWWCVSLQWQVAPATQQYLRDSLPNCHCDFVSGSSTGRGWRELPNYYAQRDLFGMRYMTG